MHQNLNFEFFRENFNEVTEKIHCIWSWFESLCSGNNKICFGYINLPAIERMRLDPGAWRCRLGTEEWHLHSPSGRRERWGRATPRLCIGNRSTGATTTSLLGSTWCCCSPSEPLNIWIDLHCSCIANTRRRWVFCLAESTTRSHHYRIMRYFG